MRILFWQSDILLSDVWSTNFVKEIVYRIQQLNSSIFPNPNPIFAFLQQGKNVYIKPINKLVMILIFMLIMELPKC